MARGFSKARATPAVALALSHDGGNLHEAIYEAIAAVDDPGDIIREAKSTLRAAKDDDCVVSAETWDALDRLFERSPDLKAGAVPLSEIEQAEQALGVTLADDYRRFVARYGAAIVGALPVYGLGRARPMGKSEASFVDVTRRFRGQGWPGVEAWTVISMDHSGNPVGLDASGAVWISDHDAGTIEKLADDFEGFLTQWCLPRRKATMTTFILREGEFSVHEVLERLSRGDQPLCPRCRSRILVARTPEEAKAQGIPPGMQCAKDARHFQAEFLLRR